MPIKHKNIAIVGAGLVGSLLSIYLSKKGSNVSIYEKRNDIRKDMLAAGRSINLALSDRGRKALREVGVEDKVMSIAMPMYKRIMHSVKGQLTEQYYGKKDQAIYSVSRKDLNGIIMSVAEDSGVKIHFSKGCVNINFKNTSLNFNDSESVNFDLMHSHTKDVDRCFCCLFKSGVCRVIIRPSCVMRVK